MNRCSVQLPPAALPETPRCKLTKTAEVVRGLQDAVARGEKRTRRGWASHFKISYFVFCNILRVNPFARSVIIPQRAESAAGTIFVSRERRATGHDCATIRIPACAINAAGLTTAAELRYTASPGRIVIEVPA
jgi:hypothetical protein